MKNLQPGNYWYSGPGYGKSQILVRVETGDGELKVRFSEGRYPQRLSDIPSLAKFESTNSNLPLGTIRE